MPDDLYLRNQQINQAAYGPVGEHDHVYEPTFRLSRLAGTPHRRCTITGCQWITLDSDECDCADFEGCPDCRAWAEQMLADNCSPWNGLPIPPGTIVRPLPPAQF